MTRPLNLTLLAALLCAGPAAAGPTFEPRREADPPIPLDPNRKSAGVYWTPPRPTRKGRECPTCGAIYRSDIRTCADTHQMVKTRRVVLDHRGRPVRRRK